jgi:tRNA (mo5U34)-methyltransferase
MDSKAVELFLANEAKFKEQVQAMGFAEAAEYHWYHTIDLGNGLVTPGTYDYRGKIEAFHFPDKMDGMSVLDVGSATGFFSFEFERRGANVVSVELPSLEELDRFPGQTTEQLHSKLERMSLPIQPERIAPKGQSDSSKPSTQEMYHRLLEGPFKFCQEHLHSKVERCFSTVYDISPEKLGTDGFDLIFVGDVLLHTFSPWLALASIASVCKKGGVLILSQGMPDDLGPGPAMKYVGGVDPEGDDISWWWPNQACFEDMLKKMGFHSVEVSGHSQGILRTTGFEFNRTILHARK